MLIAIEQDGMQCGTVMIHNALNTHFGWHIAPIDINTPRLGGRNEHPAQHHTKQ